MQRRVVITGAGWITPLGRGVDPVWNLLTQGRSGIGPITLFDADDYPVKIAAEVPKSAVPYDDGNGTDWRHHPRQTRFALAAAIDAARVAGIDECTVAPARMGVSLGCGETFPDLSQLGPWIAESIQDGQLHTDLLQRQAMSIPHLNGELGSDPSLTSGYLAAEFNAQGPNANFITACTSGSQAIGFAREILRRGEADVMLAGAAHSMIHPIGVTGFHRLGVLSTSNELGGGASRPFDRDRDGFVVGEGGAVIVLETLEHARARGAEILGELTGYSEGHDAFRITDAHPRGRGLAGCMRQAMDDAQLNLDDINYISAHGTGTLLNDRIETTAVKDVFGTSSYNVPISSVKSMIGHSTTACGALEVIVGLQTVRTGLIPPTMNYEHVDPECDLDYVPNEVRETPCRHVLSNNLGFGGQNAVVVVSRYDGTAC